MAHSRSNGFAVIGLGTFGSTVAAELARAGDYVLGIDILEPNVRHLADSLAEAIIADGRDEEALREAGVGSYGTAVVAIGEDLEANILCTMNVRMLGVPSVWVKAMSRTHHRILAKIGADRVVQPEKEIGERVAQVLHNSLVHDYLSLGNGYHVVDARVPEALAGRSVGEFDLLGEFEIRTLGIMRGTEFLSTDSGETALAEDDRLLLLGRRQDFRRFADSL